MKLYLMRHGEAELGGPDNERALSAKGKGSVLQLAHFLSPLKLEIAHLFHSDKLRASETASLIERALQLKYPKLVRPDLDPNAAIHDFLNELSFSAGDVFVVGHLPYLGKLASYLTTGNEYLAHYAIQPGSLLCFEVSGYSSQWQLVWMMNPALLLPVSST